jgi:serine/threonine protein kinase
VDPHAQIGPYRIERLLGTGSFATVWLGYDPSLDARVAIKVLADNWSHDLRVRERFRDEGRLLWRLDHERVVRVHALGDLPDGRPYLVMAWANGGSLRDRLAAGPMTVGSALRLLREIAAGVAVLHREGIVHRDLSPGNVLFRTGSSGSAGSDGSAGSAGSAGSDGEQVVIADLGLAKALAAASGLTARAGTPGFMAPEQDDPLALVDTRTDVYGLGRLGQRLLGRTPPAADGRLRPDVPPRVGDVLRTATQRRPGDRYRDATAFGAALDRALAPAGPGAVRRRRVAAAGLVAMTAALVAALAADSVAGRGPARAPDQVAGPAPPSTAGPSTGGPSTAAPSVAATTRPAVVPPPPVGPEETPSPDASIVPTTSPPTTPACDGPEQFIEVDVPETELEPLDPMCFAAGGELRLKNTGPGTVTVEPRLPFASTDYEAGVTDIQFLRPGTVTVTIRQEDRTDTLTVVIIS